MANEAKLILRFQEEVSKGLKNLSNNFSGFKNQSKNDASQLGNYFDGLGKKISLAFLAFQGKKFTDWAKNVGKEAEDLNAQFIPLLGSVDAAKGRMEELSKFAATTPFQLPGIAKASKILETLTKGTLSTGEGLRLVGDNAAVAGADFAELSVHVGRAFSSLQSNRAAGESVSRLQELGLITGETRNKIELLQQAARGKEAWKVLEDSLKKNSGGMEILSQTASGLQSTISDQLDAAIRQILDSGIWDAFRASLKSTTDTLQKMLDDGTFKKVGEDLVKLVPVVQFAQLAFSGLWNFLQFFGETIGSVVGGGISNIIELFSSLGDVIKAVINGDFAKIPDIVSGAMEQMKSVSDDVFTNIGESFQTNLVEDMQAAWDVFDQDMTKGVAQVGSTFQKAKDEGTFDLIDEESIKRQKERAKEAQDLYKTLLEENKTIKLESIEADLEEEEITNERRKNLEIARFNERLELLQEELNAKREILAGNNEALAELDKNANAKFEVLNKERSNALKKVDLDIAKDKEKSDKKSQKMAFENTDNLLKAGEVFLGGSKKTARAAQAISVSRGIMSAGQAAIESFTAGGGFPAGIPAMLGSIATTAPQLLGIKAVAFGRGGVLPGTNVLLNDKGGGEGILTSDVTNRLGGIGAINSINNRNSTTKKITNEIHYSPTNIIKSDGGSTVSIVEAMDRDKEKFASWFQKEIVNKNYLTIG